MKNKQKTRFFIVSMSSDRITEEEKKRDREKDTKFYVKEKKDGTERIYTCEVADRYINKLLSIERRNGNRYCNY